MRATLSEADHRLVTEAVAAAERGTSGEIVTIVTTRSDHYADIAWAWAAAIALLVLAVIVAWPALLTDAIAAAGGGWADVGHSRDLLPWLLVTVSAMFIVARLLLGWPLLRGWLTPAAVKRARVRDRAVDLFRAAAEGRTSGRSGILVYLSLTEHRAEIVADSAIHARVAPERWGEAMAALIDAVREDRVGAGMAAAVAAIGAILAEQLPREAADADELPDRLIEL